MEPFKSLIPLAKWLLRICIAIFVFYIYFDTFIDFSFNSTGYFIAAGYIVLTVLLIIGGILKKDNLTVISGLLICILSVVMMFISEGGFGKESLFAYSTPATIGFYFLARGNKG